MGASATLGFDSPNAVTDNSMSASLDRAWANLAGDQSGSAFNQTVTSAKDLTDQHVAQGNLPNVQIAGDLTAQGVGLSTLG